MTRANLALAGIAIALAGCTSPTDPMQGVEITGAVPMEAPASSSAMIANLSACAGVTQAEPVRWFKAEAVSTADLPVVAGMWVPPNAIYLVEPWDSDPRVVRHELLHHLLQAGNEIHGGEIMARCAPWWGTP